QPLGREMLKPSGSWYTLQSAGTVPSPPGVALPLAAGEVVAGPASPPGPVCCWKPSHSWNATAAPPPSTAANATTRARVRSRRRRRTGAGRCGAGATAVGPDVERPGCAGAPGPWPEPVAAGWYPGAWAVGPVESWN